MAVLTIPNPNERKPSSPLRNHREPPTIARPIKQQIEIQEPGPHKNLGATRIGAATHGARPKGELRD